MTTISDLITLLDSQTVQTVLALVVGLAGSYHRYRQTGSIPLTGLPWRAIRRLLYTLRRRWFTVSRPDKQPFTTTASLADVRDRLAAQSYNPGWPLSYHYYGEDLNARRYFYDPTRPHPHRQLHIRGFETSEGVELIAHEEPAPEHHPRAHLKELGMHDATQWVGDMWAFEDLDPRGFNRDA